jgi:hypothetical protein
MRVSQGTTNIAEPVFKSRKLFLIFDEELFTFAVDVIVAQSDIEGILCQFFLAVPKCSQFDLVISGDQKFRALVDTMFLTGADTNNMLPAVSFRQVVFGIKRIGIQVKNREGVADSSSRR